MRVREPKQAFRLLGKAELALNSNGFQYPQSWYPRRMKHPAVIDPLANPHFRPDKMGKTTLFQSARMMVGLNAFEPGQSHALHAHHGMDKLYHVLEGEGLFLLDGDARPMKAGQLLVAPEDVPHGIENNSHERLVVLVVLAPAP